MGPLPQGDEDDYDGAQERVAAKPVRKTAEEKVNQTQRLVGLFLSAFLSSAFFVS